MKPSLGELLQNARKAKGVTFKQMGEDLGIPLTTISAWTRGQGRPKRAKWKQLAEYLQIPVESFEADPGAEEPLDLQDYEIKRVLLRKNVWAAAEDLLIRYDAADVPALISRLILEAKRRSTAMGKIEGGEV